MGVPFVAVTFDADQTLWDFSSVYRKALDATIESIIERGYASPEQANAARLRSIRDEIVREYRGRPHSLEEVRNRSFQAFLEQIGHTDVEPIAAELTALYMHVRFTSIELFPDVVEVLGRLGDQYPLGLVSNGNTHPDRCGLPTTFSAIVMGPDFGFEKPDRRAFEEIGRQLGVAPSDLLHIGDDWDEREPTPWARRRCFSIERERGRHSLTMQTTKSPTCFSSRNCSDSCQPDPDLGCRSLKRVRLSP